MSRMATEIPFHRPSLSELEKQYLLAALEERYWGGGVWVERVESALKVLYDREVVVVSSGTAALHVALSLLLAGRGGEVIVPTWTFTATASEVIHAGGTPVLVDVGPSLHLTPEVVEAALTSRTKGVIVVHYAGEAAPICAIRELCDRHGLWLIEDTCHALPAYYEGKLCGTFGEIATLSFHATKPVAAGQGGALLIRDRQEAERARRLRRHGWVRSTQVPWEYEVVELGWNYSLSDFQAAVALAQIERLQETWSARKRLAQIYSRALQPVQDIELYSVRQFEEAGWHLFPIFWKGASLADKNRLLERMQRRGYPLNVHYKPLHLHAAYRPYLSPSRTFPVAERAYQEEISLPLWPDLPESQAWAVVEVLREELRRFDGRKSVYR
ncbi:MAG: DegT/DnrJ/EryC1/StrS family aminotransferase [Bacteroidia bacterium]|nr:DegT/DnrJ/EryC1/StrS family aminotransferase [Bacteroidia bacterium]